MQVMRKRIRVYSACRKCVNTISHAHIPHKYILQVSDAELIMHAINSGCMLHIVSHTTRDGIKNLYCLYSVGDICNVHVYCHSSQVINVELLEYHDRIICKLVFILQLPKM